MDDKAYQELAFRLKILSAVLFKMNKQDIEKRLSDENIDISPQALAVLRITKHDSVTIQDLSKHMMIAPASLVPVIDSLVENKLITRGSDPNDRRRNPLLVTDKGKQLLSKVPAVTKDGLLAKSLSGMGPKKSAQLIQLMEELTSLVSGDDKMKDHIADIAKKEHN